MSMAALDSPIWRRYTYMGCCRQDVSLDHLSGPILRQLRAFRRPDVQPSEYAPCAASARACGLTCRGMHSDRGGDDERPPEEQGIEAFPYCSNLMMSWRLCSGRLTSCITAGQADERVADRHELQNQACTNSTPHVRFDWASIQSKISSVNKEMVCWLAGCRSQHPHWNIAMTRAEGCSSVCGESGVDWGSAILNPTNTSRWARYVFEWQGVLSLRKNA